MADVGSEREGVAEPRDVFKHIIFDFLFFLLFLLVLVLTNGLGHTRTLGVPAHKTHI